MPMRVTVRTQAGANLAVEVAGPEAKVGEVKALVERQDAALEAQKHRVLYNGKFLADWQALQFYKVADGNTLLLVPGRAEDAAPAPAGPSGRRPRAVSRPRHPLLPLSLAGGHYQRAVGAAHDGELGEVVVLEPIEGESSDVGLGIMLGLLLGFVSVVCLVEGGLSPRLRLGICIGVSLQLMFATFRIIGRHAGDQKDGIFGIT